MSPPHGRRVAVRILLVTGTVLAVAAIFALWANRQALNPDNWSQTSATLLQDDEVRSQVSAYLVDEAYANVDVAAVLARELPPQLAPLAGPAAGALRNGAERVANRALERPRVQQLWKEANRVTAQQFVNIAEGDSKAITANGNAVVLDLRVVLIELLQRLGLPQTVGDRVPASAGKIKIMSADQVSVAQNVVSAVRGLAVVLPALALGALGLAVYLAAGRRRRTLMWAGIDLGIAGVVVLVGREIAGQSLVDALVAGESVRPAGNAAWAIGTGMLQDIAQAAIVIGLPMVFAAWIAGPSAAATSVRRRLAPTLRDHPDVTYGVAAGVVLLIVAWGPIHATRLVIPVLLFFGLTMLGVAVLRRQVAEEFPPDGLERLVALHDGGSITDAQFADEKRALLANGGPGA